MPQGIDLTDELTEGQEWSMKAVLNFNGGLNLQVRPEDVSDDEVVEGQNLRVEKNRTLLDYGYADFGAAVDGNPRRSYQMFLKSGSSFLVLITNNTFYTWSTAVTEWQFTSNGTDTTLAVAAVATDLTIDVVDDTDFTNGERIGITLDDGTQHQTTINGVPAANVITLLVAMPGAAAIGKAVVEGLDLNGSDAAHVSLAQVPSHDWLIFANGSDVPKRFDGSTVEDVPDMPAGLTACNLVHQFGDYTIMLGTVESGTSLPQRVRVSDTGRPDIWTTGNATFYDLYSTPGFINAVADLGPYMIVYKSRSIVRFEFIGSAAQLFSHEEVVKIEGAVSRGAVVDLGTRHIFVGHSNLYEYKGGFDITPIGDKIRQKVFGVEGETNPSFVSTIFLVYVEALQEVWFFYPHGANTSPQRFLRYHLDHENFYQRDVGVDVVGYGAYINAASRKWSDLIGTWTAQDWVWSSQLLLANSATIHMGGGNQQVYEYDYFVSSDDGVAISYQLETRDFFLLNKEARFDRVDVKVKGSNVLIEYSIDEGASWETWGIVENKASFAGISQFYKQVSSDTIRFRLTGSEAGFGLESFSFRFRPEIPIR